MIELTINGKKIKAEPGSTILQAAQQNNIFIPNMCYDKRLRPYGGCRLCVVEVEGQPRLFAACSTPVTEGMVVYTETPKLQKARKTVLELLLLHHPLDCPICDKAGECDLQDLAFKYGPSESRFVAERKHDPERLDAPIVERNPNRCILCGKCVRVCAEHQGVGALAFIGRGFKTKVSPAFEETLNCEFCGQCVDACPVGALGTRHYRHRSRVWFMEEYSAICPYCGCGCTTNVSLREGMIIRARGKEGVGINDGNLCSKGRFGFDYIYSENRLKTPLIKKNGEYVSVSWDEALGYVADRLKDIKEKYGPSVIGAIGSQRCTMEDNFLFQKFVRGVLETDNIDSAARFGYAKAVKALQMAFGLDSNPIKWDSPLNADLILVVESDITSTLPVWGLNFIQAKNKGAKLIVADIKETKLARHSTDWLRIKPGSGIALLNGIAKYILDEGLYDKENIPKIANFDSFVEGLKEYTISNVSDMTGIGEADILRIAKDYAISKKRLISITSNSSENTKSINTILAATNLIILMGDSPNSLQIPAEFSNTLGAWSVGVRPLSDGLDAYKMLYEKGNLKALYITGENPLVSFQDILKVEEVLKDIEFLVVQDIFFTDTAKLADVVLPACSWLEKEGMFMSATGNIQRTPKLLKETGVSLPDWKIFIDLAKRMGKDLGIKDITEIRAAIADAIICKETKELNLYFHPTKMELVETIDKEYPMYLITANILQHSGALSALSKNLDSVVSDAYLQINTRDAKRLNIINEHFVRVRSKRGEVYLKAMLSDEVPEGIVFAPIHFSHAKINTLTYPSLNGELPLVAVSIECV
jgi:NADH-quinone oxidoreductase chain G